MVRLPLVRIPAQSAIHKYGASANPPRAQSLLRFNERGWTINPVNGAEAGSKKKPEGWAVLGDGEGRRRIVEVCCPVLPRTSQLLTRLRRCSLATGFTHW